MTPLRPAALAATWLAASLAAGVGASLQGFAEGVWGDGTAFGIVDATLGWLLGTLLPSGLALVFVFLPIAALLEYRGARSPLAFLLGGAIAGALPIALFASPHAYGQSVLLLLVPGIAAGAVWWLLAIAPQASSATDPPVGTQNG